MKLKRGYREDVLIMNSSWKGWFPPGTLEKGLDHYESGAVSDLKTTECGYEAVVLGSREYHVEIELNDGEISGMKRSRISCSANMRNGGSIAGRKAYAERSAAS